MPDLSAEPLSPAEKAMYGADARRGPDGAILERGSGAKPGNVKLHAHAAIAHAHRLAAGLVDTAKALAAQAEALAGATHAATQSAGQAQVAEPAPAPLTSAPSAAEVAAKAKADRDSTKSAPVL